MRMFGMGLTQRRLSRAFTPADLFTGGLAGDDWWAGDLARQWVDDAGATPVSNDGDKLGRIEGNVNGVTLTQANAPQKALYKTALGISWWQADGLDDGLASTANIDFGGTDKVTLFAAASFSSTGANAGALVELSAAPTSTAGAFRVGKSSDASGMYHGMYKTALLGTTSDARGIWPVQRLLCVEYDLAGATSEDEMTVFVDAAEVAQSPIGGQGGPAGSGNFGAYPLYLFRRGGASLPFSGRLYSLTIVGGTVSAARRNSMFEIMAARSGF